MYSSSGTGSSLHLAAEGFAARAGIKLKHIPYQGSAPAMFALIKGEVPLMSEVLSGAVAQALFDRGIQTIVLNIIATNEAARCAYERVGFREYCRYFEGPAVRSLASAGR